MSSVDYLGILTSPAGIMLVGQIATLLFVVAGLAFMIGRHRFAKRLMGVAVIAVVVPFAVAANSSEIKFVLDSTPRWVLAPTLAIGAAIVLCWILWGVVALCFGPAIANTVIADVLAWLIKGTIVAVLVPYRGLSGLVRRFVPRDSAD
jgi:hypothetical protein